MMNCTMMFRVVIRQVRVFFISASFPVNFYVLQYLLIAQPIVTHVPCLTFAEMYVLVHKTVCGCIVGFNGSGWLQVSESIEDAA